MEPVDVLHLPATSINRFFYICGTYTLHCQSLHHRTSTCVQISIFLPHSRFSGSKPSTMDSQMPPQPPVTPTHVSPVPDLLFLSANFLSESVDNVGDSPSTPKAQLPVNALLSRRYSGTTFTAPPDLPVGQPSHLQVQRGVRAPPRLMYGLDSVDHAIWEDDGPEQSKQSYGQFTPAPPLEPLQTSSSGQQQPPSPVRTAFDRLTSPVRSHSARRSGYTSRTASPVRGTSPVRQHRGTSPVRNRSPVRPFNFTPQDIMTHQNGSGQSLAVKPAHRKGHRYKHSSVLMNMFQEPVALADTNLQPEVITEVYPIPTWRESMSSASYTQKLKLALAAGHVASSILVFTTGVHLGEPQFLTLAHLVFYDSLGSVVDACVDVASNFEVWSKLSIAYPFGLGRLEVLVAFALSASLVMVGCDLVSHFVEELVVGWVQTDAVEHGPHHIHASDATGNTFHYELVLLVVIAVTWASNYVLGNILRMMDAVGLDSLAEKMQAGLLAESHPTPWHLLLLIGRLLLRNPIRLLTLTYTVFLVAVPVLPASVHNSAPFDVSEVSTLVVAATLCLVGWNLVRTLGGILLVSFPYSDYDYNVLRAGLTDSILSLPSFKATYSIDHLFLTKVNYRLYIAGVGVTMKGGSADDESRLLFEIARIFERRIHDFDRECRVESTVSVTRA